MSITHQHGFVIVERSWTNFKKVIDGTEKRLHVQYETETDRYRIFAIEQSIYYEAQIYLNGSEPTSWTPQEVSDNTAYLADFESNWKALANRQINKTGFDGGMEISASEAVSDANRFLKVSDPFVVFGNDQVYFKDSVYYTESTTGGGTSAFLANEACVNMQVGTASGDRVIRQTRYYFPNHITRATTIMVTALMGAQKANVRQRIGYFDNNDGLFFEQNNVDGLKIVRRFNVGGSPTDTPFLRSSWNIDKLDGFGQSKIVLDTSKVQTFVIDFSWPSRARFGFLIGGRIIYCHGTDIHNNLSNAGISTPNLPVRWELENTGTSASSTTIKQYGTSVLSDCELTDFGHYASASNGVTGRTAPSGAITLPIIAVRLKAASNRGLIIPKRYSILTTTATRPLFVEVYVGGTVTGGAWASASPSVEANVTGTAFTGGVRIHSCYVSSAQSGICEDLNSTVWACADFAGTTDPVTILVGASGGTAVCHSSLDWKEVV